MRCLGPSHPLAELENTPVVFHKPLADLLGQAMNGERAAARARREMLQAL